MIYYKALWYVIQEQKYKLIEEIIKPETDVNTYVVTSFYDKGDPAVQ